MHVIGAKAKSFIEALDDSFVTYQKQVVKNAKVLASEFERLGYRIVSGGTDNHLVLIDVKNTLDITGKDAEEILGRVYITVNKNSIPYDELKPFYTSGIRLGSPALTTRGLKEDDMVKIATFIDKALRNKNDEMILENIKEEIKKMMVKFPLFQI